MKDKSISFNIRESDSAEEEMNSISRRILPGRGQIDRALWRVLSWYCEHQLSLVVSR